MIRGNLLLAVTTCFLVGTASSLLHGEEAEKAENLSQGFAAIDGTKVPSPQTTTPSGNLGKELHNPLANLKEIIFQLDLLPDVGPYEQTGYSFSVQPVFPVKLPNDWKLVTYTIIPVNFQPQLEPGGSRTSGLGDTSFYGYFVPPKEEGLLWGVGPALQFPTHTSASLGNDSWAAGPALIIGVQPGKWSIWGLFDNIWSYAGAGETINEFSFQYQAVYMLPKDWFLISNWVIDADWESLRDDRWTVPVGAGFGKQFKIGNSQFQAYGQLGYNVVAPAEAATWRGIVALTYVF